MRMREIVTALEQLEAEVAEKRKRLNFEGTSIPENEKTSRAFDIVDVAHGQLMSALALLRGAEVRMWTLAIREYVEGER